MMLRSLIPLALALVLALTSQSMAVARGASAATGHMVLCTGTGPVAVYTDAQGQPTSAPHICPDSALNVLVVGPVKGVIAPMRLARFYPAISFSEQPMPVSVHPTPPARGPPLSV